MSACRANEMVSWDPAGALTYCNGTTYTPPRAIRHQKELRQDNIRGKNSQGSAVGSKDLNLCSSQRLKPRTTNSAPPKPFKSIASTAAKHPAACHFFVRDRSRWYG